ncbi:MAG: hybrid sensor histidine kinase/response regulator [Saprospiraceae bacterium]|nr:MAG: hybrid sensor histidine kinase/response regulator [Saprospiraceae bacterium]
MFEDAQGRLWISTCATLSGPFMLKLLQYDGYSSKVVNLNYEGIAIRSNVKIVDYLDGIGLFGYIKSEKSSALFVYNEKLDSSYQCSLPTGQIAEVIRKDDDSFWIIGQSGQTLHLYEWKEMQFKAITSIHLPWDTSDADATNNRHNNYFLIDGDYLYGAFFCQPSFRYHLQKKTLEIMDFQDGLKKDSNILCPEMIKNKRKFLCKGQDKLYYLPSLKSKHFYESEENSLLFRPMSIIPEGGTGQGIFEDASGNKVFLYKTKTDSLGAVLVDKNNLFWDYTSLVEWAGKEDIIYHIYGENFKKEAFIGTSIGIYQVNVGNLSAINTYFPDFGIRWLAQLGEGQYLVKRQGSAIYTLEPNKKTNNKIALPCWSDFFIDRTMATVKFFTDQNEISWAIWGNEIFQLMPDAEDGLCKHFKLDFRPNQMAFLPDGRIAYLLDKNGQIFIWIQSETESQIPRGLKKKVININVPINAFFASKDGFLWITTLDGLYKLHPDLYTVQKLGTNEGFEDFRITEITEGRDGKLWVGTVKGGLHLFNPATNKVEAIFNKENGLTNNTIVNILVDDDEDVWVGTYNGLSILSGSDWKITNLNVEDGLSHYEFNRKAQLKSTDGKLLLGTVKGLNIIDPLAFKKDYAKQDTSKIYLTELSFYDGEQGKMIRLPYFDPGSRTIPLEPDHRNLKLKVALSNYGSSSENKFVYKLENVDKEWHYLGTQHAIHLSSLPEGKYQLLIHGIDKRGNWTNEPLMIHIWAKAHFYQTTWFYLLLLALVMAIALFWLYRLSYEKRRLEVEVTRRTQEIQQDKEIIQEQTSRLQEVDEMKTRFFANISHELRTPATLIATPVEHALNKHKKEMSEELKKSLQLVQNNSKKLLDLIEELLELSRFDADKIGVHSTPTPLKSFCQQLFSAFESAARLKQIEYRLDYGLSPTLQVSIDQKKVANVLNNLLSNALKFTSKGGEIILEVAPDGLDEQQEGQSVLLVFKVKDNGRGILQEDLHRIFDRYYQTQSKVLPKQGGAGIGLALANELAALMGGNLQVETEWGKGSTFCFRLPAKVEKPILQQVEIRKEKGVTLTQKKNRVASAEKKTTILIVEDNRDMQQLLVGLLSDAYHCLLANDGAEAWTFLTKKMQLVDDIELIISDLMMPEMDGYTLLEKIKTHPQWQYVPVIMLTARAAEEDRLKALRLGVDDYLNKPFSVDELLARAHNLVHNYQQRKGYHTKSTKEINIDFEATESVDQLWLAQLEEVALLALHKQQELSAAYLADKMSISARQLLRQLKPLTGLTVKQYIQEVKLQKGKHFLEHKTYATVAEVAYTCGFNTPGYFSTLFEKRFGKRPNDYLS